MKPHMTGMGNAFIDREQRREQIMSERNAQMPTFGPWSPVSAGNNVFADQHWLFRFSNGYGASIVTGFGTYAKSPGTWELAVLRWQGDDFELDYSTPITNDVEVFSESELPVVLSRVASLGGAS